MTNFWKLFGIAALTALVAWSAVAWRRGSLPSLVGQVPSKNQSSSIIKVTPVTPAVGSVTQKLQTSERSPVSYEAKPVKAKELVKFVDRKLDLSERISPDMVTTIRRVRFKEDYAAVVGVLCDTQDHDTVRNEAADLLRRSAYNDLSNDLLAVLVNPNEGPRFRSFCIQHLYLNEKKNAKLASANEKVIPVLREALEDRDLAVRREAMLALVRMKDEVGINTVSQWLGDAGYGDVRDLAIRCAHDLNMREHLDQIRRYSGKDQNESTRIAALVVLSQWKDEQSRAAFESAANAGNVRLQRAGKRALEELDRGE